MRALLEYAEKTESDLMLFLYLIMSSGVRKGEILALTWDGVDFENGTISICKNRTGSRTVIIESVTTLKTKNGYRTILLSGLIFNILEILGKSLCHEALQEKLFKNCCIA